MSKQRKRTIMKYTDLYSKAEKRYRLLSEIMQEKKASAVTELPGKIHIAVADQRVKYYLRSDKADKTGEYISKTETSKIRQYVQKAYDEKVLKLIKREINALERFLKSSDGIADRIKLEYSKYPDEVKWFIDPIDMTDEDYIKLWEGIRYETKGISDYATVYETKRGERVRSKSELNIANALAERGIPYKYECPLKLKNGIKIHPDFTVLHVKERRQIYWEHRGMMDDKDYATKAVLRIKTYRKNGIFIGQDLIITEETSADPLGTNEIDAVITDHFGKQ
ncbi:MAG: hypothetical protein K6E50_12795 [Lachnospiraceae bacterium]|nr:hypothetical protein [Lachnospiraceae bacterium]